MAQLLGVINSEHGWAFHEKWGLSRLRCSYDSSNFCLKSNLESVAAVSYGTTGRGGIASAQRKGADLCIVNFTSCSRKRTSFCQIMTYQHQMPFLSLNFDILHQIAYLVTYTLNIFIIS